MTGGLKETVQAEGLLDIMDLTIVPYGNAQMASDGTITCQHGEGECEGNMWESCAISHYPDVADHFAFVLCMETAGDNMLSHVKQCATGAGMDYDTLNECYSGSEGTALQKAAAAATPDHPYVPYVIVNGKESPSGGDDLLAEVCSLYQGAKPTSCPSQKALRVAPVVPDLVCVA